MGENSTLLSFLLVIQVIYYLFGQSQWGNWTALKKTFCFSSEVLKFTWKVRSSRFYLAFLELQQDSQLIYTINAAPLQFDLLSQYATIIIKENIGAAGSTRRRRVVVSRQRSAQIKLDPIFAELLQRSHCTNQKMNILYVYIFQQNLSVFRYGCCACSFFR